MKLLSYRIACVAGIGVGTCAIGASIAACGSSSSSASNSPDGSTGGGGGGGGGSCSSPNSLTIAFSPMYSASIPGSTTHTFQVPAVVTGVSGANVVWSASDMTAVGLQADPATGGTMITVLKPGTVTINAAIGSSLCGSAQLVVTQATEDDWMAGNARYNNGQPLINPFAMNGGDGGAPMGPPAGGFKVPGPNDPSILEPADGGPGPACTNCHGPTATGGVFQGIEHTPEQTAGFSDDQLTDIIVHGIIPDGGYYDTTIIPYQYWKFFHKWSDMTPAQQKGIIVYLRSLTPVPQSGKTDFGGAFGRDGGTPMQPPASGDDSGSASDDGSTTETDATTLVDAGADATPE
jgi:hypothetical protein